MLTEGTGNFLNILAQHLPSNIRTFSGREELLELGGRERGGDRKQVITVLVSHPSARIIKGETQRRQIILLCYDLMNFKIYHHIYVFLSLIHPHCLVGGSFFFVTTLYPSVGEEVSL